MAERREDQRFDRDYREERSPESRRYAGGFYTGEGPGGRYDRDRYGPRDWEQTNRFGAGERPRYFGTGSYGEGGTGFGGGYGHQGYDDEPSVGRREPYYGALGYRDDIGNEYGNPISGSRRDYRADYTSRRSHGENPFGYYGQYHRSDRDYSGFDTAGPDYRDRYYSGGYDEGRVSTWRPDTQRAFRRGPKGYQRSDERIREDVSDRLMQATYIDSSEVTVDVSNGKVTLDGTVPERRMKHAIEDLAESCAGVQDVDNRIRVQQEDRENRGSQTASGVSGTKAGDRGRTRDRTNA